jgi:hypothetical protein
LSDFVHGLVTETLYSFGSLIGGPIIGPVPQFPSCSFNLEVFVPKEVPDPKNRPHILLSVPALSPRGMVRVEPIELVLPVSKSRLLNVQRIGQFTDAVVEFAFG